MHVILIRTTAINSHAFWLASLALRHDRFDRFQRYMIATPPSLKLTTQLAEIVPSHTHYLKRDCTIREVFPLYDSGNSREYCTQPIRA